jgi:hypothetical protein
MVRRGSTVRVRQRALQKRRKSAFLRSDRLAPRRMCGGYGAVYGAFAFGGSMQPFNHVFMRRVSSRVRRGRTCQWPV